ncbi:MAG: DEAD/DEAH box helicase [Defluviitaleaceae bacterium]|nr:DEAD/DEAH box helicase [Defluviitaleaceae bacterium]
MLQKPERPNKQAVKATIATISLLEKELRNISVSDADLKYAVSLKSKEMRQCAAHAELAMMDVDVLNADKQGIRVSALKRAGINNIAQLYDMSVFSITAINGIGEQTAKKIKNIVNKLHSAILPMAKIQINLHNKTTSQDTVIQCLYILLNGAEVRTRANHILSRDANVKNLLKTAKPASGAIRWFFTSSVKKAASIQAYQHLETLDRGVFKQDARACIDSYKTIFQQSLTDAYRDFENNAASYYTLLANLSLNAIRSQSAGLPDDLVFAVEQYPLDLTYMKTVLRCYQDFGAKYILHQRKVLLGDEMGLGKTIQALAAIADLKSKGATHFLVVCPAGVLINWERESIKHTNIPAVVIHGADRDLRFSRWKIEGGIGITNYESLVRLADTMDINFAILVVDEAHLVKNPEAQRTQAILRTSVRAGHILFMTGTPLENRVEEMCFLVDCLRPDIADKLSTMKTLSATQSFKDELTPVYLRRVRDDVLTELPDLIESEDWLEPGDAEFAAYYDAVIAGNFMAMRRVSWNVDTAQSSKAARLLELCDEAREEGRKVIVFSFFRDTLDKVCALLGNRALPPITGNVSTAARQQTVDAFTESTNAKVLVAQVQAGGVGLNIQAASVVIFCEPQIKPSLESQAISRAYRMGQVRNVHVHRLLCANTVDESMMRMLQGKQAEFKTYADESVIGIESQKEQSENDWIREIVAREKERITNREANR